MRLIDADELCDDVDNYEFTEYSDYSNVRDMIDYAPTIDAKPVKHRWWIETNDDNKKRCSECDVIHLIAQYPHGNANYCPNCGARMDGGAEQ